MPTLPAPTHPDRSAARVTAVTLEMVQLARMLTSVLMARTPVVRMLPAATRSDHSRAHATAATLVMAVPARISMSVIPEC